MATVAQPLPESAQSGRQELRLEAAEASAPGRIRSSAEAPIGPDRDDPYVAKAVVSAELSAHVEPSQRISLADCEPLNRSTSPGDLPRQSSEEHEHEHAIAMR